MKLGTLLQLSQWISRWMNHRLIKAHHANVLSLRWLPPKTLIIMGQPILAWRDPRGKDSSHMFSWQMTILLWNCQGAAKPPFLKYSKSLVPRFVLGNLPECQFFFPQVYGACMVPLFYSSWRSFRGYSHCLEERIGSSFLCSSRSSSMFRNCHSFYWTCLDLRGCLC